MNLLKQNGPFCLVYSAAMILDEDPNKLHEEIGTTGQEIWWGTTMMRGIHIQEIQDCCNRRGKCIYPVELFPYLAPDRIYEPISIYKRTRAYERMLASLEARRAIIITENHAVAWDGLKVYDPKGFIKSLYDYIFHEAWILGQI